jgi:hypothetical protein
MWYVWETGEVHIEIWWGNLSERDTMEDRGADGSLIYK